ncbi:transcriptional regulator/antitoxin MazE [Burkholderia gladioli]|uniref:transcriptional regulator/antitoxin MazE n=1 Tax=Burkholderia gladioli TaxID=28095 RepID=UPI00163FD4E0|nr:transcriptional regulator/antitoxin MazE [Burkholderia gladioli]
MTIQRPKRPDLARRDCLPADFTLELTDIDKPTLDGGAENSQRSGHTPDAMKRFSRVRYLQQLREGTLEPHPDPDFGAPRGSEWGAPGNQD